jgi:hypothetical protein
MLATDVGAYFTSLGPALIPATITAGAGNDNVEVDGPILDRFALRSLHLSGKLTLFGVTTLGAGETLTIAANLQHGAAANLSDATDFGESLPATVVKTGAVTNGQWHVELDVDLTMAKRYLKAQVTANLSRANTDTVAIAGVLHVGGGAVRPAA